jgi:hypothetical protein
MSSVVRALLLCWVALAIPLQGMAAVVMPLCAALDSSSVNTTFFGHPLTPAGAAQASADHAGHAQHHDMSQGMSHEAAGPLAHHTAHVSADAGDPPAGHAGHGMLKCCSATGGMAMLSSTALPAQGKPRAPAPPALAAQLPAGVILDGLDRPPQPSLA